MLAAMDNDWRECINIDKHLHVMTIKAKMSHSISNTLLSFIAFVAVPYLLSDYSIHAENGIFVLVKAVGGYLAIIIEVFVICFAGEYLSSKSKSVADAIYETLWYDMPSHQSKIIVFIIMRSQKRLTITAEKVMDMSFETFTSIMKASVSYVSVLYAMY
ncbi:odorant receptor coreceptor [Monomorium pharaonis]|uniref:odorant receptor coreceptor n=1 Tax=Monomorium pharaonis TaxID=307658 RepID=UPI001747C439|nr:odorant receptor coreceptor [Monomorium pharaonis]